MQLTPLGPVLSGRVPGWLQLQCDRLRSILSAALPGVGNIANY
jgi:hypothetical protein